MAIGLAIILAIGAAVIAGSKTKVDSVTGAKKQKVAIDTTHWKKYTDAETNLRFSYPSDWNVESKSALGDRLITITSKKQAENKITIYASKSSYLGFDGLPQQTISLAGHSGVKVNDALLGLEKDGTYFTFDAGLSADATPVFQELVKTVSFN